MSSKRASERFFLPFAKAAIGRPWLVLFACAVLTVVATYGSSRIAVNTSTEGLFSPKVEFIRNARAYEQAFPNKGAPIVAVVDASTPERAEAVARSLAERLRGDRLFEHVDVPGSEAYFRRIGLLFLDIDQLGSLRDQLQRARPALAALATQPNLAGIAKFIELITAGVNFNVEIPPELSRFVRELGETTRLQAAGRPATFSWMSVFGLGELQERGKRQFVLAYPLSDKTTVKRVAPALDAVRAGALALSSDEAARDVRIRLTGLPVLDQQELDAAFSGALYASALSFALVALTLVLGIRSWRMILLLIITLVVGTVWTSGLAAVAVRELNLISLAFGVLFFAIGVDFGTHLGLRYMEQVVRTSPANAITRSVVGEGPAITLSVICASVGFLSFLPTHYLGLAQLGIISALGMAAAFAVTLILLPAMLAVWPPNGTVREREGSRFSSWVPRRAVLIVSLAALGTLAAAVAATRARVDVNPLNLQNPNSEAVRVYRELARDPATSPYEINLAAPSLQAASDLANRLRGVDGVVQVRTVESFIPDDQAEKLAVVAAIGDEFKSIESRIRRNPATDDLADGAQKLQRSANLLAAASAAAGLASLQAAAMELSGALGDYQTSPGANQLEALNRALAGGLPSLFDQLRRNVRPVTLDDMPPEFRRDWLAPDGTARIQVIPTMEVTDGDKLEAFAARVQAVAPAATGVPIMISGAAAVVRQSFAQAVVITAIAIIAIIVVVRRRLADVVLILTPLVLASVWTLGVAAVLGLSFNFANVIVIPVLLGVGVASSIHVVSRAREMDTPGTAGRPGFLDSSTPRAVLVTDANTALAFATLAVSSHRGLFSLGVLLALATTLSLVASLIVLPAILTLLARRRSAVCKQDEADAVPAPARVASSPAPGAQANSRQVRVLARPEP
jgi:hopanoid biosynthesis associated RND transporter like protein HpnN